MPAVWAVQDNIGVIREQRSIMQRALERLRIVRAVIPSDANFLAVRFADAGTVYQRLLQAGIVVRDIRRYLQLDDALRITIGTPEENAHVLAVLHEMSA